MTLYHGSAGTAAERIKAEGLRAGSFVATARHIAARAAEVRARELGTRGTVFAVEPDDGDLQWTGRPGEARTLRHLPAAVLADLPPGRDGQPMEPGDRNRYSLRLSDNRVLDLRKF